MTAEEYIKSHWIPHQVWKNLERPKHQKRFRELVSFIDSNCKSVLDFGCACGHSTNIMAKMTDGLDWSGCDESETAIDRAKRLFPRYDFYPGWPPISFDCVICSEVIEHVENDYLFVENLKETTKDQLILTTPDRYVNDPGHLRIYDKKMLRDLIGKCEIYNIKPFYYVIWRRL